MLHKGENIKETFEELEHLFSFFTLRLFVVLQTGH